MSETSKDAGRKSSRRGSGTDDVIAIKKYANRRLYNTATSSYVTLDYLSEMVKNGQDFTVHDAKTGDDITRSVLTQIIFEEESKGQNLLPVQFLRQLIQFYGDNLQSFLPSYLEMSMDAFSKNQEKFREQMRGAFGGAPGYNFFEEAARQNMVLFENAMKMFAPTAQSGEGASGASSPDDLDSMKQEIAELKRELNNIKKD